MAATASVCPRCSTTFVCGIDSDGCWCAGVTVDEPTRTSLAQYYDGCLCRECLQSIEDARPQVPTVREFLARQLRRRYGRRTPS